MGNDEAFRVIHDRYRQRLFGYTRQMLAGSRSDAEDALQDVFLRAYKALRADNRPVTLRAWLYRVAHNRCIDQLRRPTPAPAELLELSRTPLHDPLAEAERREDLRRLVEDVRRLPEQQRSALLMRELEGLTYAELCDALGATLPAVKSLLVRARIGLAESIEARDTACLDIRADLAVAHGRGVRASGKVRRHMRDCDGCRHYRTALRARQNGFDALSPGAGPLALVAKVLGIGGASSGAAAGSGAVAGGGGVALGGGAALTASKVAAIVASAAVVGGGAVEVRERIAGPEQPKASRPAAVTPTRPTPVPTLSPPPVRAEPAPRAPERKRAAEHRADRTTASTPALDPHELAAAGALPAATPELLATGGAVAPDEAPVLGDADPPAVVPDVVTPTASEPAAPEAEPATSGAAAAPDAVPATREGPDRSAPATSGGSPPDHRDGGAHPG
jgi:RNA polymerase sigma factor (sigma-70 family)